MWNAMQCIVNILQPVLSKVLSTSKVELGHVSWEFRCWPLVGLCCYCVGKNMVLFGTMIYLGSVIPLTHWGSLGHICISNLIIIGSDNGSSPGRLQAIIWTNTGILLIGALGTNFSEILIKMHTFSFKKMQLKKSSAKWQPFCLGINVLNDIGFIGHSDTDMVTGLPGKPFKPFLTFFLEAKTVFSQFLWKAFFSLFFLSGLYNCPKMPFSELMFAKNSWGRTPRPPPVEGKILPYPPHIRHWGASRYGA